MLSFRTLAVGASMLVLIGACTTGGGSTASPTGPTPTTTVSVAPPPTIKIGSDGFDEARVVAEVYAQVLEANGYTVDRAGIGLGTRDVTNAAIWSGQIDMKPEYIGSGTAKRGGKQTNDPAANEAALQAILSGVGGGVTGLG